MSVTISKSEPNESIAATRVLLRLGTDMYEVIKYHLRHHYHIRLDESFRLYDLGLALHDLIGVGAAEVIMKEIYLELDALCSGE